MANRQPLLALVLAAGCTPQAGTRFSEGGDGIEPWAFEGWYQDYFTPTFELCGEPQQYRPYEPMVYQNGTMVVRQVSVECEDAMLADLKVDWSTLDGWDEYQAWSWANTAWLMAYGLLAWPMGQVEEMRLLDDEETLYYVRGPFIDELEQVSILTGEGRVNAILYNMLMSSVQRTRFIDEGNEDAFASVDLQSRTLNIKNNFYSDFVLGMTVIVHEMTHLWSHQSHVVCPESMPFPYDKYSGTLACDATWEGAYSSQLATARLLELGHDWGSDELWDGWIESDIGRAKSYYFLILEP